MELSFERVENGRWYVVFPDYDGSFEDLEMMENADKMLDALTSDGMYVTLEATEEQPVHDQYFTLEIEAHDLDGAHYNVCNCDRFSGIIWLCNVTHEFFGEHPEKIYCTVIG